MLDLDIDLRSSAEKQSGPNTVIQSRAKGSARWGDKTCNPNSIVLLGLSSLDFLHKLSTVNITTELSNDTLDEGNSRDPHSSLVYKCGVEIDCTFQHKDLTHLRIHEASCTSKNIAAAVYEENIS
jgi:hypothetical protein